jgi:predicted dinucleotide-binding enzyme
MNVTIIGAGNMGRGIGTRAAAGGHSVTFVDANPETAEKTAADVRASAQNGTKVSTASLGEVQFGDVVVFAVWYGTNIELAKQLGTKLAGKIVVDIANPLNSSFDGLATAPDSSSAEDVAKAIASGAKVVKAFNTTYAGTLVQGEVAGQPLDVFIDVGPLSRARQIEGMQFLHIVAQGGLGTNWASTIKILS